MDLRLTNHHRRSPSQVFRDFIPGKKLGQGKYGVCKEALRVSDGAKVAIKVIDKGLMKQEDVQMMENEIQVLEAVSRGHPNVITLHDHFSVANELYLVMDLCTGGELFDQICEVGAFFEDDAQRIISVICSAVSYLHRNGIVHRDIKPENILLSTPLAEGATSANVVLADFGISKIIDVDFDGGRGRMLQTQIGSPGYMAPEVIRGEKYGSAVDMWAIGVLTYLLLSGYMPFHDDAMFSEMQNACLGRYEFSPAETWSQISALATDFISHLLVVDPERRFTAQQAMEHPWLSKAPKTHEEAVEERKHLHELKLLSPLPISSNAGNSAFPFDLTPDQIAELVDLRRDTPLEANLAPLVRPRFTARADFRRAMSSVRREHRARRGSLDGFGGYGHLAHHKPVALPGSGTLTRSMTSNALSPVPARSDAMSVAAELDNVHSDGEVSVASRGGRRMQAAKNMTRHQSEDGYSFAHARRRLAAYGEFEETPEAS